jgi:hypothetical protein
MYSHKSAGARSCNVGVVMSGQQQTHKAHSLRWTGCSETLLRTETDCSEHAVLNERIWSGSEIALNTWSQTRWPELAALNAWSWTWPGHVAPMTSIWRCAYEHAALNLFRTRGHKYVALNSMFWTTRDHKHVGLISLPSVRCSEHVVVNTWTWTHCPCVFLRQANLQGWLQLGRFYVRIL